MQTEPKISSTRVGGTGLFQALVMTRAQTPTTRSTRTNAFLFLFVLLALVFPAWGAAGEDVAARQDAMVISALVTAEETYLTLSPKMSALSKGLLNLRLPGPGAEAEAEAVFAPSVSVSDI